MHVIFINPDGDYYKLIFCAVVFGFIHVFIGAVNMGILIYSVKNNYEDMHGFWCTFGYHFFTVEAILVFNHSNGWTNTMKQRHRRFTHIFLQLCGMACALVGTIQIIIKKGLPGSLHGITGIITAVLTILSLVSGPFCLFGRNYLKIIHVSCGMPTFLMSSISLCASLFTVPFKGWADTLIIYLLTVFIIFYSMFIIATCLVKCVSRI